MAGLVAFWLKLGLAPDGLDWPNRAALSGCGSILGLGAGWVVARAAATRDRPCPAARRWAGAGAIAGALGLLAAWLLPGALPYEAYTPLTPGEPMGPGRWYSAQSSCGWGSPDRYRHAPPPRRRAGARRAPRARVTPQPGAARTAPAVRKPRPVRVTDAAGARAGRAPSRAKRNPRRDAAKVRATHQGPAPA